MLQCSCIGAFVKIGGKGINMENQVRIKQGILEGEIHPEYVVFKGIPYAKAPVGELRWREPQKPESWEGVRKADHFEKISMQELPNDENPITGRYKKEFYSDAEYIPPMSEDCLYLNIWMPREKSEEGYPVAFWIHGGGFGGGYSSEIEFDGEKYAQRGVILVTVEYRVNIFGFLAHPWLSAENEQHRSGNYGILDQIAALNWVYDNISAFGGNPDKITVFGQSAGSMSTQVLVSSALTKGKIAGAILQSGLSCCEDILATPSLKEEEEYGELFVQCTGAKNIDELRNMTTEELMRARAQFDGLMWKTGKGLVMVPNVDGYVLKESVKQVWAKGEMHRIPYMLGVVTDDLGSTQEEVKAKKPGVLLEECRRWAAGCEEKQIGNAYLYYFSHELPGDDWGAFHSSELWYMFGTYERCWRPMTGEDQKLSEEMVADWTSFIKNGNPQVSGDKSWECYSSGNPFVKQFR